MKFGKRLQRASASFINDNSEFANNLLDYKKLKKIIKLITTVNTNNNNNISNNEQLIKQYTSEFTELLDREFNKINTFYSQIINELLLEFNRIRGVNTNSTNINIPAVELLCERLTLLRKYIVLNYLGVMKIVKKFEKNVPNNSYSISDKVIPILYTAPFYNSYAVASMYTEIECLLKLNNNSISISDYYCSICLNLLQCPVVLSCSHRFCWICLSKTSLNNIKDSCCPQCRKPQLLDPKNYIVDDSLLIFIKTKFNNNNNNQQKTAVIDNNNNNNTINPSNSVIPITIAPVNTQSNLLSPEAVSAVSNTIVSSFQLSPYISNDRYLTSKEYESQRLASLANRNGSLTAATAAAAEISLSAVQQLNNKPWINSQSTQDKMLLPWIEDEDIDIDSDSIHSNNRRNSNSDPIINIQSNTVTESIPTIAEQMAHYMESQQSQSIVEQNQNQNQNSYKKSNSNTAPDALLFGLDEADPADTDADAVTIDNNNSNRIESKSALDSSTNPINTTNTDNDTEMGSIDDIKQSHSIRSTLNRNNQLETLNEDHLLSSNQSNIDQNNINLSNTNIINRSRSNSGTSVTTINQNHHHSHSHPHQRVFRSGSGSEPAINTNSGYLDSPGVGLLSSPFNVPHSTAPGSGSVGTPFSIHSGNSSHSVISLTPLSGGLSMSVSAAPAPRGLVNGLSNLINKDPSSAAAATAASASAANQSQLHQSNTPSISSTGNSTLFSALSPPISNYNIPAVSPLVLPERGNSTSPGSININNMILSNILTTGFGSTSSGAPAGWIAMPITSANANQMQAQIQMQQLHQQQQQKHQQQHTKSENDSNNSTGPTLVQAAAGLQLLSAAQRAATVYNVAQQIRQQQQQQQSSANNRIPVSPVLAFSTTLSGSNRNSNGLSSASAATASSHSQPSLTTLRSINAPPQLSMHNIRGSRIYSINLTAPNIHSNSASTPNTNPNTPSTAPAAPTNNKNDNSNSIKRQYDCPFPGCLDHFNTRFSLKRHQKIHTRERPHLCTDCNKSFAEKSTLIRHARIHSGQKPFVCTFPGCNRPFSDRTNVKRHEQQHYKQNQQNPSVSVSLSASALTAAAIANSAF